MPDFFYQINTKYKGDSYVQQIQPVISISEPAIQEVN